MANRRMFARSIICSGRFMRLSLEAQNLYYGLGMDADDDGFAEAYPRLQFGRITEEHLSELASKGFLTILDAEDLVVHIDGWSENNLIRRDRYTPSRYLEKYPQYKQEPAPEQAAQEPEQEESAPEKEASSLVNQGLPQVRLGKDRLGKVSLGKDSLGQVRSAQDRAGEERTGYGERGTLPAGAREEEQKTAPQKQGEFETEYTKKKENAVNMLLNSKYFSGIPASS